jgi:hypothetical protein
LQALPIDVCTHLTPPKQSLIDEVKRCQLVVAARVITCTPWSPWAYAKVGNVVYNGKALEKPDSSSMQHIELVEVIYHKPKLPACWQQ